MNNNARITRIERGVLEGSRDRRVGCNARLGSHGRHVKVEIARIETDDGNSGFGRARVDERQAAGFVGRTLGELLGEDRMPGDAALLLEYPLWDLIARSDGVPVYSLLDDRAGGNGQFEAPCYDTSIYMDDLHIADHEEAADFMAEEAVSGLNQGHKSFKVKIGRGAMHMPSEDGMLRDIGVVRAIRRAVGEDCRIMVDVNNGYNLNLAKRFLSETADCDVYWIEEPFHEDRELFAHLKEWMKSEGLAVLIADGEGECSSRLVEWASNGIIDIVQYDIFGHGFTNWCVTGSELDGKGVRSAPHHWGEPYGNYSASHLAARIRKFEAVEWDESNVPGLDTSAYSIRDGMVQVPDLPGFGLELDEDIFREAVSRNGFIV